MVDWCKPTDAPTSRAALGRSTSKWRQRDERAWLLRSRCEWLRSSDGSGPKFGWRSADTQVRPALPRHCRVDNPGCHRGAFTQMPSMLSGIRCDWNRSRTFDIKRDVPADGTIDSLPDFAVIPGSEKRAPPHLSDMGIAPISNTATSVNHIVLFRILITMSLG